MLLNYFIVGVRMKYNPKKRAVRMRIKKLCFLMALILIISGLTLTCRRESSPVLPDIKSLPELKVELVLNRSD